MSRRTEPMKPLSRYNTEVEIGNLRLTIYDARYLAEFDASASMHGHFFYEMFFVYDGTADVICDTGRFLMQKNDLYVFPPSLQHLRLSSLPKPDGTPACRQVPIRFTYERLPGEEDVYTPFHNIFLDKPDILIFRHSTAMRMIFEDLLRETERHDVLENAKTHALITMLVLDCVRYLNPELENRPQKPQDTLCSRNFIIEDFFNMNYQQDIRIEDLAERLSLSTKQTTRILQELCGQTFRKKLTQTRVQMSKSLLRHTDMPVASIAENVGFQTANGFVEAFRSEAGMTPSQFRRQPEQEPV